ncbi:MAG: cobalamin-dependent protein [Archangiaceae bacterium]|nr:cobalamin-dependent protein [Archangiaceae bacterium]
MSTRRAALVCIDPWLAPGSDYRPFNYSARKVQAAVVADPALAHVETRLIESCAADADEFVTRLTEFEPDVIGFSSYVWSFDTLIEIGERLREVLPNARRIFGGPSARPEMFKLPHFQGRTSAVDALVVGEGEEVFREICGLADGAKLDAVAGLQLPVGASSFRPTAVRALPDLSTLASPYALGLVPQGSSAHVESFRGCPLSCSFCQWGDERDSSRVFPEAVLRRELAAISAQGLSGVYLVDAALNLSARAFKNLDAALRDSALWGKARLRTEVYPANMTDAHLRFLAEARGEAVGIGLQSFDEQVLEGVERPFDARRFERVVHDVAAVVPETTVEIILGLPGDHPDNFKRTLERARKLPTEIRVFRCLVLPGALMSRAPPHFELKYDPVTLEMQSCLGWPGDAIERTARWVEDEAVRAGGERNGQAIWRFPRPGSGPVGWRQRAGDAAPEVSTAPAVPADLVAAIGSAVRGGSDAQWELGALEARPGGGWGLELKAGGAPLRVFVDRERPGAQSFRVLSGFAFSYSNEPRAPSAAELKLLERVFARLATALGGAQQ